MQRLKDASMDPTRPQFDSSLSQDAPPSKHQEPVVELVSMTKAGVTRQITVEELAAHSNSQNPWFVIRGEVSIKRLENKWLDRLMVPTGIRCDRLPERSSWRPTVDHAGRWGRRDGRLHCHPQRRRAEEAR